MDRLTFLRTNKFSYLLAIISGAIVTLSLAPFNFWPIGILSTFLLAWILIDTTPAQAAMRGWFYGLGLFGAGTSWVYVSIHVYGNAPVPLATALTTIFSAGLGLFTCFTFYIYARWVCNRKSSSNKDHTQTNEQKSSAKAGSIIGFAAVFTLGEWLRSWFLTGFPWLYLGYGHLHSPLAGWAPIAGVLSISFIIALSGSYIAHCLHQQRWHPRQLLVLTLLWVSGGVLKGYEWSTPSEKGSVDIAMIQANIPQEIKWNRDQLQPTLNLYTKMSEPLWSQADIIIWPEAAIPTYYRNARGFLTNMERIALEHQATLITGIPYLTTKNGKRVAVYNSAIAVGNGEGKYFKQHLVPFGEYVPLESVLRGLIDFFDLPMSSFSRGPAEQPSINASGVQLSPFICYEVVYPDLVAKAIPNTDILLTISNDTWFGGSIGPLQHLQMAQMRALENSRYLIRATSSGVSAIVNQYGQIIDRSEQFKRQILSGTAVALTGFTPFSYFGSWPIVLLCTLICITSFIYNRLRG